MAEKSSVEHAGDSVAADLFKPEEQTVILTRMLILIELDFRDALNILLTTVSKNRIIQSLLPKKRWIA